MIFTPIFLRKKVAAYATSLGHHIDIGGEAAGPTARATDVYSEGIRIPPTRFDTEKDLGPGILEQFLRANVRAPDLVMGDINAQLAANRTGERRFLEMLERFGVETVGEAARELQDYSERLAREAIRAIPDGLYEAEDFVDDNGFTTEPLKVKVAVAVEGDLPCATSLRGLPQQAPRMESVRLFR